MSGYSPQGSTKTPDTGPQDGRPDFRHVTHWVFDLDNTLYRADSGLFAQIDARMTQFVAGYLGVEKMPPARCRKPCTGSMAPR